MIVDLLTIAADKVVYKLGPEAKSEDNGTEDSSNPAVSEEPPVSPTPRIWIPTFPPPPPPLPRLEVGPSREAYLRDVEAPFKQIHGELAGYKRNTTDWIISPEERGTTQLCEW